jgi:hypothetical protein
MRSNATKTAAVIVDDAEDPDRKDAQDPDGREVERARDSDPTRTTADFVFERGDEIAPTRDDASKGLLGCVKAEDAGGQVA